MTLGVIGLGLMGGSFSLAAKQTKRFTKTIGYSRNMDTRKEALALGLVDEIKTNILDLILESDFIVLAIPVNGITAIMSELRNIKPTATIIDLGSTKHDIVKAIPSQIRKNFVATHPMCGTEYSGPKAAFSSLYKENVVVICNKEDSAKEHVNITEEIYKDFEMEIVYMDAKDHDRHAAFISHLPHVISYSLAKCVLRQEDKQNILALAAGGFRDMSRLAKSPPSMWSDIFAQNRPEVLKAVAIFQKEMTDALYLLATNQDEVLKDWMTEANKLHEIFKPKNKK